MGAEIQVCNNYVVMDDLLKASLEPLDWSCPIPIAKEWGEFAIEYFYFLTYGKKNRILRRVKR